MLKKFILGTAALAVFAAGSAMAAEKTIRFGSDATYPPFESTTPTGEIVGFDIDLAKAMCERMKATCTFQNQSWDGIIPALRAKKFDVIASSMSITPERKKAVAFTQKIWTTPNPLIGKKGLKADTTPEGTKGLELGIQQGTIQDKYATKYFKDANIKRYKTLEDALKDLVTGRVQAVFADSGVADEFLAGPNGKDFAIIGTPLPSSADLEIFGEGTGFAVRKQDKELLDALNKAFDEIRADGTYDKIAKKYFSYDVYN
ncbi:transporter substrate-binding domain-containing protein [Pelistega europaea]|uniref:Transporter substrate-binding domain-containing protein n=1 Tax=Pelistega europaea TaxID=106147 RepID=A0A7Y4LCG1_9BURK|nr:transporter substrate-binding domain-containing protein [Pelistega europaea]NOL49971.1 transporter substrate-binding domain-containing protein [Pelistega europaea]